MSELIRREDAINAVEMFFKDAYIEDSDVHCTDMVYEINHIPTASPWHRVEEELPEIGQLILLYYGGGYSIAARTEDEMWERKRYWKLEDGYWERIEDDYYWMPIEPPKEDA